MILSHQDLRARFEDLVDRNELALQPCSIDLSLDTADSPCVVIEPVEFRLFWTQETVNVPLDLMGQVHGKSSWARVGIQIHSAGLIDPGFNGRIVLEIVNFNAHPVRLMHHDPICQVTFTKLTRTVETAYGDRGNHFQNQGAGEPPVGRFAHRVIGRKQ